MPNALIFSKPSPGDSRCVDRIGDCYRRVIEDMDDEENVDDGNSVNVIEFANSWTYQAGFPLIRVERDFSNSSGSFLITQEPFHVDHHKRDVHYHSTVWTVPIFSGFYNHSLRWLRGNESGKFYQ